MKCQPPGAHRWHATEPMTLSWIGNSRTGNFRYTGAKVLHRSPCFQIVRLVVFLGGEMAGIAAAMFLHAALYQRGADIGNHVRTTTHHHM